MRQENASLHRVSQLVNPRSYKKRLFCAGLFIGFGWNLTAQSANGSLPDRITRRLLMADCLNIALQQGGSVPGQL
jgi:hypothetical protein